MLLKVHAFRVADIELLEITVFKYLVVIVLVFLKLSTPFLYSGRLPELDMTSL